MRNRLLTPLMALALLFLTVDTASAQLRADGTMYLKARVGVNAYAGDRDNNPDNDLGTFLEDGGMSFGGELGYAGRFGNGPLGGSIGLYYLLGDYEQIHSNATGVQPPIDHDISSTWRHTGALMGRLHFLYDRRFSPYLQLGAGMTFGEINGNWESGFTPMGGLGLDIALTDRFGIFLEGNMIASIDDAAMDLSDADDDMDWLAFLGGGLRFNFRSPFTAVQVLALECPTELQVGETATFSASSNLDRATPPVEFRWNFGDGTTATGEVATHSFSTAGTYTVNFTASNQGGRGTSTRSCTVTVVSPPEPAEIVTVNASPQNFDVCQPTSVQFSANVRGDTPIDYAWDFGDGETGTGANPTHTYSDAGTYTVTLTASNEAGQTSRTLTIRAEPCVPAICTEITEMNSAFFGRNASTLSSEGRAALQENLEILLECSNLNARIEGFAAPGERNPQQLSEDRARAVEQFYLDAGVPANRLDVIGQGQVTGTTTKKEGTSQYRRVDTIPVR